MDSIHTNSGPDIICNYDSCPIGIDFGTTNSAMSRYVNTRMITGPYSLDFPLTGSKLYPSIAYLDEKNDTIRTGISAYSVRFIEPGKVIQSIKRYITEDTRYILNGREYKGRDIARSIILDFLKEIYSVDHNLKPRYAVVTVPYYFGENENSLIKEAAEEAINECFGCNTDVYILPEQVAASIAGIYINKIKDISSEIFFIYDIGGGTLDLTLVRITSDEKDFSFEVLANDGISRFGGDDIDELISDYVTERIRTDNSALTEKQKLLNRAKLLDECREAKHRLSYSDEYTFICSNISGVNGGYVELVITREILENLISGRNGSKRNMMGEFAQCIDNLYAKAMINPVDVGYVIPVGGTSFIPLFRRYVSEYHNNPEEVTSDSITENLTMVAKGASIYAAMKSDEIGKTRYFPFGSHNDINMIKTKVSHSLFLEKFDGSLDLLVKANSDSPVYVNKRYYPSRLKNNGQMVDLSEVRLFQGEGESRKRGRSIGSIDFSGYEIYTHGRDINRINIDVNIEVTDTLVKAHCLIPKADADGNDIEFTQIIHD